MRPTDRAALLEGPIVRSLIKLAVPIVIANILQAGYQLIDAFWVGRLGGVAVAAVSVTTPIAFLTISLGFGFAIAGSTLVAQYFGAGNKEMVDHAAGQTLLMILLFSVFAGLLGFILAPEIVHLMGVAPDVVPGAVGFMRVSFIGLIFNFFFFMFQGLMRGVGVATMPVYIVAGTVVLNFALDPLFIFGWGGTTGFHIPAYGVMGAALATLGTQSLAALIGFLILAEGKFGIHLHWKELRPDWSFIKRSFLLGFPASIEQSARALGFTVMTFLVASFGTTTIASYGIGSSVLQVVIIPAMGLSMAISALAGQNIGAGNIERASEIAKLGAWIGFAVLSVIGLLTLIFSVQIATFFVPEDLAVVDGAARLLRVMSWSWGFLGVQLALGGVFRASGNMMTAMVLTLVSQWVFQFPLAYILAMHTALHVDGLWWAFPISNLLIVIITVIVYSTGKWKRRRIIRPVGDITNEEVVV